MKLTEARTNLATWLIQTLDESISVVDHLPDSITPPVVMIAWGDPWIKPATLCAYEAAMEIMVVAQRIEPGGQYETLENIVSDIVGSIKPKPYYQVADVSAPYPLQVGGNDYLAASINLTYDVEG
jgi:hypothetical protein